MKDQKSRELLQKYIDGSCTPEEKAIVNSWYNKQANQVKAEMSEPDYEYWDKKINRGLPRSIKSIPIWLKYSAAAAVLLVSAISIFYFSQQNTKPQQTANHYEDKITPGKNAATLTLANGKKIILSDATTGQIAKAAGVTIIKTEKGELVYEVDGNSVNNGINTLSTARGETYRVRLPDGTLVWLNAASSLSYSPSINKSTTRNVELKGEGYFEVAKDKARPFIVKTLQQEVTVLGTHFNISSYPDEIQALTTLLEGSVKVGNKKMQKILIPGQQSSISASEFSVKTVETDDVVAWKNGLFLFNDEALESIMRKISRWYDVEIVYQDADKSKLFWGGVSRFDDVSKVLSKLESTGGVHFKIKGRRITVTK